MRLIEAAAADEDAGARLDSFLAGRAKEFSRSRLKQLLIGDHVHVNGRTIRDPAYRVKSGDRVVLSVPPPRSEAPAAQAIPLDVVYEDDDLLVIDKPAGLVVHPAAGNADGTLVNALIARCGDNLSDVGGEQRRGIVHRLDRDTSGLLVVARNNAAHRRLSEQFADHGRTGPLVRGYLALAWGVPEPARGTIDAPIARDPRSRERRAVRPGGRRAVTHYEVRERYAGVDGTPMASLVECRLETGRTHQIRLHLLRIGHPAIGDSLYGAGFRTKAAKLPEPARTLAEALPRQALHAYLLGFAHPATGEKMLFERPFPPDLARLRDALKTA